MKPQHFHQWQLNKIYSTVATITQTLLPGLTLSAKQTDDLGQTLTSPKDGYLFGKRQLYPMSPEITIVHENTIKQHQDTPMPQMKIQV